MNGDHIFNLPNEKIAFCDTLVRGVYIKPIPPDTLKKDSTAKKDSVSIKKDSLLMLKDTAGFKQPSKKVLTLLLFEEFDSIQKILKSELVNVNQVGIYYKYPVVKPEEVATNPKVIDAYIGEE